MEMCYKRSRQIDSNKIAMAFATYISEENMDVDKEEETKDDATKDDTKDEDGENEKDENESRDADEVDVEKMADDGDNQDDQKDERGDAGLEPKVNINIYFCQKILLWDVFSFIARDKIFLDVCASSIPDRLHFMANLLSLSGGRN